MSERFTKFTSNYVMRNKHQKTDFGLIRERNWVTTNSLNVLRFGSGRRIWYNSGNFVFTTSNVPTYHKKHKLNTEIKKWGWDDCKDADGTVNTVKPNFTSNDIRDYVYYGSCVELVRATIEEIIMDFPGCIITTQEQLSDYGIDGSGYIMRNDFNIDLHHKTVSLGKYDNEFRFISSSWKKYCVKTDKSEDNVTSVSVGEWLGNKDCPQEDEGKKVIEVTITTEGGSYLIEGYSINKKIIYVYNSSDTISIQPQKEYIDEYFANLTGFKAQLLRQDTKPFYKNKFKTPVEYNFQWYYPEEFYIWPSYGYCVDVGSSVFSSFFTKFLDMAEKFDELWTDNIYRSMTHESIKNFDWTYSREYYEGEEQDNIDGGERMMKILHIYGRIFDDIKYYIDTIKLLANISYDKINNGPEALMSDILNLKGLDVVTSIGEDYDINEVITKDFLDDNVTKDKCWPKRIKDVESDETEEDDSEISTHKKWYQSKNSEDVYPDVCDNELMRRFNLSVKHMMKTKGTQHAIDMLMGMFGFGRDPFKQKNEGEEEEETKDDYTITEEAYYTKRLIPYNECVDGTSDDTENEETEEWKDWTKSEEYPVIWGNVSSTTKGELAEETNRYKDLDKLYYENPFSGVPLSTILIGSDNEPFMVPYYDPYVRYDGDLVFQEKGGWGRIIKNDDDDPLDDEFDYQETLSYLHVVGTIGDMLSLRPTSVQKYDIYYVVNLEDYTQYDENPPMIDDEDDSMTVSHYFVLLNENETQFFESWRNIVVKPTTKDGKLEMVTDKHFSEFFGDSWTYEYDGDSEEGKETYEYAYKHMMYLESILSTNVGNNPHVGYGNYDEGEQFIEYMRKPFKYSLDNQLITDVSYNNIANLISFDDINDDQKITDKIQIIGYTKKYNVETDDEGNEKIEMVILPNEDENPNANENDEPKYDENDKNSVYKIWYINTKVLTITNNIESPLSYKVIEDIESSEEGEEESEENKIQYTVGTILEPSEYDELSDDDKKKCVEHYLFNCYFKNVIMPYLMQVIPSTTILKLKGF